MNERALDGGHFSRRIVVSHCPWGTWRLGGCEKQRAETCKNVQKYARNVLRRAQKCLDVLTGAYESLGVLMRAYKRLQATWTARDEG